MAALPSWLQNYLGANIWSIIEDLILWLLYLLGLSLCNLFQSILFCFGWLLHLHVELIILSFCSAFLRFSCSPLSRAPSPSSWSPAAGCWSPAASRPLAPVFSITKKKSRRSYLHLLLLDPSLHLARLKPIGHLCLSLGRVHLREFSLQYSQYPPANMFSAIFTISTENIEWWHQQASSLSSSHLNVISCFLQLKVPLGTSNLGVIWKFCLNWCQIWC